MDKGEVIRPGSETLLQRGVVSDDLDVDFHLELLGQVVGNQLVVLAGVVIAAISHALVDGEGERLLCTSDASEHQAGGSERRSEGSFEHDGYLDRVLCATVRACFPDASRRRGSGSYGFILPRRIVIHQIKFLPLPT